MYNNTTIIIRPNNYNSFSFPRLCNKTSIGVIISCWDEWFVCSGSSVPLQLGLPVCVPPQYSALREVSMEALRARLRLLYHFSDLMYSSWRLLNLSPNNQVYTHSNTHKQIIFASIYRITLSPLDKTPWALSVMLPSWLISISELHVTL